MIPFSDKQKAYIKEPLDSNVYLRACPGAGKTEVIAAKVAREARQWQRFPAGMVVLSFSRSATSELAERIASARRGNSNTYPHFVGTVDSFILNHIVSPLAHLITGYQGKDGDYSLKVVGPESLSFYHAKYAIEKQRIFANRFDWDTYEGKFVFWHASAAVRRQLNTVKLLDWQLSDLRATKRRFNSAGFATYKDVEGIAISILTDVRFRDRVSLLAKRFPAIIIDECQDLSLEQIAIFTHLADLGVRFHLVGDLDQAIYGFRNCFPNAVEKFIAHIQCAEMSLDENFRSGQLIVNLHGNLVKAGEMLGRANYAPVTCYLMEYKTCPTEVLPHYDALAESHSGAVIVARGHSMLTKLNAVADDPKPVQLLARAIKNFTSQAPGSLHLAFTEFSCYLAANCMDCETMGADLFYRPVEVASAEDWHMFLSDCLLDLKKHGMGAQDITWQQWCTALKGVLPKLSPQQHHCEQCVRIIVALNSKKHSAPAGIGASLVDIDGVKPGKAVKARRLATIHEVKGETHDLTMLVSSARQGAGAHWAEWLEDPRSEAARFAYVASSRPRHILIWAVKTLKAQERIRLCSLGFSTYP